MWRTVRRSYERVIAPLKSGFAIPLSAPSEQRMQPLHPPLPTHLIFATFSLCCDLLDSYRYPSHPLLHDMDVGRIHTASNHFWSSMFYDHKAVLHPHLALHPALPTLGTISARTVTFASSFGVNYLGREYVYTAVSRRVILTHTKA